MELSSTEVEALNWKLPPGYLIEPAGAVDRPKRTEADKLKTGLRFPQPAAVQALPARVEKESAPQKMQRSEGFRKVYGILQKLKNHASIGPFLQPVDRNKIVDYYDIIHCPIDLSLVEKRLMSDEYLSSKEFAADVRKMWSNSFLYNSRGTDIYIATIDLSAYFENLIKGNEDIPLRMVVSPIEELILPKIKETVRYNELKRRQLGARIKMLQPKYYKGLYEIVKNATGAGERGHEFQFDIEMLPDDVCFRLEEYTSQSLSEMHNSSLLASTPSQPQSNPSESSESEHSETSDDPNVSEGSLEEEEEEEEASHEEGKTQEEAIEITTVNGGMSVPTPNPAHFSAFFLPAGSFSSRHNSTLNSETDRDDTNPREATLEKVEEGDSRFVPSQANVIIFEAATPAGSTSRDPSEAGRDGEVPVDDFEWEEREMRGSLAKTFNPRSGEFVLPSLGKSMKTMQCGLFRSLMEGQEISIIPEVLNEGSRLETIDSTSSRHPDPLLHELDELRINCKRYESQNEALRKELQSCAGDIKALDKSKRKAAMENSHLRAVVCDYQSAYGKLSEIADKLAGALGSTAGETKSEDLHHVVNHIQSQVEIVCSRYNRTQAMHDHLTDSTKKLTKDLEIAKKSIAAAQETIDRQAATLRSKETLIEKLEDKLMTYQSRMSNGSTLSTMCCYSSVRASTEEKLKNSEYSPIHGAKAATCKPDNRPPSRVESSPDRSATTPYNTPAVSFLESKKRPLLDPSLAMGITESDSEEDENLTEISTPAEIPPRPPLQEAVNRDPTHQHTRSRSIKDSQPESKAKEDRPIFIKLRYESYSQGEKPAKATTSISPCVRAYLKGATPTRRNTPPSALFADSSSIARLSVNLGSSARLAQTTVLRGSKTGKSSSQKPSHHRKPCRV